MIIPKYLEDPDFRQFAANAGVTLLSAVASIVAYYCFGGLFSSIIASLVVLPVLMGALKLSGIKIEPLQYVALFFLAVLGLPAVLLDNSFMGKIQEPISGLLMGVGFGVAAIFSKAPVIKTVVPNFIKKNEFLNKHLFSKSDAAWRKIDYIWAVEMTLSAALSMAVVFLFSTDVWFIAKYTIGPVLSLFSFGLTVSILYFDKPTEPLIFAFSDSDPLVQSVDANNNANQNNDNLPLLLNTYNAANNNSGYVLACGQIQPA